MPAQIESAITGTWIMARLEAMTSRTTYNLLVVYRMPAAMVKDHVQLGVSADAMPIANCILQWHPFTDVLSYLGMCVIYVGSL